MDAESLVNEFLEGYGLVVERFTKKEMKASKTPDFKVKENGELRFYCEVKNSEKDSWLDEQLDKAEAGIIAGGVRSDPIFNRLTAHIHKARKQFDAVNLNEEKANVLAIYNEDENYDFSDLLAVATGNFFADDGTIHPIYKNYSEGRVKGDIEKIHLFIWLDADKPHRFLFNPINSKLQSELCSLFAIDPNKIEVVRKDDRRINARLL